MYIIQTTTAILIAFLALLAWSEVRNCLARGRSRSKDPEAPDSPRRLSFKGWRFKAPQKSPHAVATQEKPPTGESSLKAPVVTEPAELRAYKLLYHKLHKLEQHRGILP